MTILSGTNYCAICNDVEHDHASVCTICGSPLQVAPRRDTTQEPLNPLHHEIREANRELRMTLQGLRTRIHENQAVQQEIWDQLQVTRQEIQTIMDPAQYMAPKRSTSAAFLSNIQKITMENNSYLFHKAQIMMDNKHIIHALIGDIGSAKGELKLADIRMILAEPITGYGGIRNQNLPRNDREPFVLYFERGDITFAQKAILAQAVGAKAVIIGNNVDHPWPYLMQDSKNEAQNVNIRTVMVKSSDRKIVKLAKSFSLIIEPQLEECIVCTEMFSEGQHLIQLPCQHVFHDTCLMPWLNRHNTCPYCRLELPTDDADYEEQRRREHRTHAGSAGRSHDNGQDFYA